MDFIRIERTKAGVSMYVKGVEGPVHTVSSGEAYKQMLDSFPGFIVNPDERVMLDSLKSDKLPADFRAALEAWGSKTLKGQDSSRKTYLLYHTTLLTEEHEEGWEYRLMSRKEYEGLKASRSI